MEAFPEQWASLQLIAIGAVVAAPVYVMYNALILRAGALVAASIGVAAPIATYTLDVVSDPDRSLAPATLLLVLLGATGVFLLILASQKPEAK